MVLVGHMRPMSPIGDLAVRVIGLDVPLLLRQVPEAQLAEGTLVDFGHELSMPSRTPRCPLSVRAKCGLSAQASQRLRLSRTHAGLSEPSRSTVMSMVVWIPPGMSSTATSSTPARSREPTGTGLGNRTLPVP